ncbi:MAG: hypothetical protein ACRDKX_01055 [Solirubrobacterales bacterium]
MSDHRNLNEMAERLQTLAQRLRDPELDDERASELAREAAEVVGEAGNEVERALRDPQTGSATD